MTAYVRSYMCADSIY